MDPRLKERLIGAVVLVALAVWLIPWLLDGPESGTPAETAALELPAAEEAAPLKTVTVDLDERARPERPAENAASAADAPERGDSQAAPAPPAVPERQTDVAAAPRAAADSAREQPTPTAAGTAPGAGEWTVQLGSFGEAGNAARLAARVETFGYEPEVSTYKAAGRDMHRVRVGPHPSRARAEAVASALTAHGFVAQVVTAD